MFENKIMRNVLPDGSPLYPLAINQERVYDIALGAAVVAGTQTLMSLDPADAAATPAIAPAVDDILRSCPTSIDLKTLSGRCLPLMSEPHAPFIVAFVQEIVKLNALVEEVKDGLTELRKYLSGQIPTNRSVELLGALVTAGSTPPEWQQHSWSSLKNLSSWSSDLLLRHRQLFDWTGSASLAAPKVGRL